MGFLLECPGLLVGLNALTVFIMGYSNFNPVNPNHDPPPPPPKKKKKKKKVFMVSYVLLYVECYHYVYGQ